jgi:hypothetical protein
MAADATSFLPHIIPTQYKIALNFQGSPEGEASFKAT